MTGIAPIREIAEAIDICEDELEFYGNYKAKVGLNALKRLSGGADGKLILVTAVNPTPAGEGKTTVSIGLSDALSLLNKKVVLTLREPSLGPIFGMKGAATGGGRARVVPSDDINLHFTGDFHAVCTANNLLAAILDNHIYHGNALGIDSRSVTWKRCVDLNDRQLRFIVSGLSGKTNGSPREDGFDITAASEVMAILCLSGSVAQLKENLKRIIVAYTWDGAPVTAGCLNAHGAMAALLKDAIKPNLVQTAERTPVLIHGGPFANIAHGCNSVIATRLALKLADYVITEAGFGADLGAEKFCDIKCRLGGFAPSACVIVASIRALKHHGGMPDASRSKARAAQPADGDGLRWLKAGMPNLLRHINNMRSVFNVPVVVAINRFDGDGEGELAYIRNECLNAGAEAEIAEVWSKGGEGGTGLAKAVLKTVGGGGGGGDSASYGESCGGGGRPLKYAYDLDMPIVKKIEAIARTIYGADGVDISPIAKKEASRLEKLGLGGLPVCIAKTQYSFTDDPKRIGAPSGFRIIVRNLKPLAGAGFIVAVTGDIMTMPGLPKIPASERIDVDEDGHISGLI